MSQRLLQANPVCLHTLVLLIAQACSLLLQCAVSDVHTPCTQPLRW